MTALAFRPGDRVALRRADGSAAAAFVARIVDERWGGGPCICVSFEEDGDVESYHDDQWFGLDGEQLPDWARPWRTLHISAFAAALVRGSKA